MDESKGCAAILAGLGAAGDRRRLTHPGPARSVHRLKRTCTPGCPLTAAAAAAASLINRVCSYAIKSCVRELRGNLPPKISFGCHVWLWLQRCPNSSRPAAQRCVVAAAAKQGSAQATRPQCMHPPASLATPASGDRFTTNARLLHLCAPAAWHVPGLTAARRRHRRCRCWPVASAHMQLPVPSLKPDLAHLRTPVNSRTAVPLLLTWCRRAVRLGPPPTCLSTPPPAATASSRSAAQMSAADDHTANEHTPPSQTTSAPLAHPRALPADLSLPSSALTTFRSSSLPVSQPSFLAFLRWHLASSGSPSCSLLVSASFTVLFTTSSSRFSSASSTGASAAGGAPRRMRGVLRR